MGNCMKTSTVFDAPFFVIFGSCAQFSLSWKAQVIRHNGVRVRYYDFPEEPFQRVEYRQPPPYHSCNCIYYPCPVCLCRTHACRILLQLEIMRTCVKKTEYGLVISTSFCQRCSVQTVASFSVFVYLWEFSVRFERVQVWKVSCGGKCPKSIFGDMMTCVLHTYRWNIIMDLELYFETSSEELHLKW